MESNKSDHKETVRNIPRFLADELNNRELEAFLYHIRHCSACREELTIQFLVQTGMQRLEDGQAFNLNQELRQRLDDQGKMLKARRKLEKAARIMEVLAFLTVALLGVFAIILL